MNLEELRKWQEMIEYLEGGKVLSRRYPRCTLDPFVLWEMYYSVTKKDDCSHFCLVVLQTLKQKAFQYAHVRAGHLG